MEDLESERRRFTAELIKYESTFDEETPFKKRFLELLKDEDAFERTHLPGHITGSAFIVSEDLTQTLLVLHGKLNKWLQPGGHADGDTQVSRVALREANEETGIQQLTLLTPEIFDLDIHPIPARKDFPVHDHYDVRFVVKASLRESIIVSEESHDVRWIPLRDLEKFNNEKSILRMRDKLLMRR